jgi:hypothetical protein
MDSPSKPKPTKPVRPKATSSLARPLPTTPPQQQQQQQQQQQRQPPPQAKEDGESSVFEYLLRVFEVSSRHNNPGQSN